ncbi:sentrin-specific protease 2-like isoform X2 [Neocloeon triangulifer]|uniref:sentrin-specific protease 2-like isoform X2 n=1 Tax=Neocloeon triangulifer TaxID=2078957 RepID=UPI00286F06BC|nr:sentrin-specific protease 2-like isoform X2 [Neocloeon triangulifer]
MKFDAEVMLKTNGFIESNLTQLARQKICFLEPAFWNIIKQHERLMTVDALLKKLTKFIRTKQIANKDFLFIFIVDNEGKCWSFLVICLMTKLRLGLKLKNDDVVRSSSLVSEVVPLELKNKVDLLGTLLKKNLVLNSNFLLFENLTSKVLRSVFEQVNKIFQVYYKLLRQPEEPRVKHQLMEKNNKPLEEMKKIGENETTKEQQRTLVYKRPPIFKHRISLLNNNSKEKQEQKVLEEMETVPVQEEGSKKDDKDSQVEEKTAVNEKSSAPKIDAESSQVQEETAMDEECSANKELAIDQPVEKGEMDQNDSGNASDDLNTETQSSVSCGKIGETENQVLAAPAPTQECQRYNLRRKRNDFDKSTPLELPSDDDDETDENEIFYQSKKGEKFPFTKMDLDCLDPHAWLNDSIINFYLQYLLDQCPKTICDQVYLFSTYFYARLNTDIEKSKSLKGNFIRPWKPEDRIFDFKYLIFPVHDCDHWILVIVDTELSEEEKKDAEFIFLILNSMIDDDSEAEMELVAKKLNHYLDCESRRVLGRKIRGPNCRKLIVPLVPQQKNGSDCGLFVLEYFEQFLKLLKAGQSIREIDFENWFDSKDVRKKRKFLANLIRSFAEKSAVPSKQRKRSVPN